MVASLLKKHNLRRVNIVGIRKEWVAGKRRWKKDALIERYQQTNFVDELKAI